MAIPILKQGPYLIASMQSEVGDADLVRLREDLAWQVGDVRARGLVVDVTTIDVMDSFTIRTLLEVVQIGKLRGVDAVIVGIQPEVAFAMVQLGLRLDGVATALDLEEGLALLERQMGGGADDVR
ncbi:MAG: STAS domain-containing protein [Actinomycetota bacterium]